MGIYSCIGTNKAEVKESLFNCRSGIGIDSRRTEMGFSSPLTGIVPRPNLKDLLDRRKRHYLAEEANMLIWQPSRHCKRPESTMIS